MHTEKVLPQEHAVKNKDPWAAAEYGLGQDQESGKKAWARECPIRGQ